MFSSVLEQLTGLGKYFSYNYWFIIKDTTQEQSNERDIQRKVCEGAASHACSGCTIPQPLSVFTDLETPLALSLRDCEVSLPRHDRLIKPLTTGDNSPAPFPSQRSGGGAESSSSLITCPALIPSYL
jgi:hypothetical protein